MSVCADRTVGAILLHGARAESPVLQVAGALAELIIYQLVVLAPALRRQASAPPSEAG